MARPPSWIRIVSQAPAPGRRALVITYQLARFWWARPSFWLDFWRIRRLRS